MKNRTSLLTSTGYGFYIVLSKGASRVSLTFFALCFTTFMWQGTWAFLFETRDPRIATVLIKLGYTLIVFLPTCLYHFLAEVSEQASELRYVWMSYGVAMVLGVATIATNYFVVGYYDYFWGFYPKAGPVHWLHVVQTCVVVSRGLYICYARQKRCPERDATRLRWCVAALLVYLFAAVDYLCNYGFEFYPPGIIFISISLGIITVAVARYDLMHPLSFAATIAHEMRTPLTTIHATSSGLARYIPMLVESYVSSPGRSYGRL